MPEEMKKVKASELKKYDSKVNPQNKRSGINVPPVTLLASGNAVDADQAREIAEKLHDVFYEYNGARYWLGCDPMGIDAEAAKRMRAIGMEMAQNRDLMRAAQAAAAKDGDTASPEDAMKAMSEMSEGMVNTMLELQDRMVETQIEMFLPCVVATNNPVAEQFPTKELLMGDTILGNAIKEALLDWGFPTSTPATPTGKQDAPNTSGE